MKYLIKQLIQELWNNKILVLLMLLLSCFTSFIYFFVHSSIDANMRLLHSLPVLSENQQLYKAGLISNTILARNSLISFTGLTAFVFGMFFYRFFIADKKQLGCLKALGFRDLSLQLCFVCCTALLSLTGAMIGLIMGYSASGILIQTGIQSYLMTGLVKGLNIKSIITGLFVPVTVYCLITLCAYTLIQGREIGLLLSGSAHTPANTSILNFASQISKLCPVKNKLSIRLALRKPISILLILFSVMSFTVMFVLSYSLYLSSAKVFESQTVGHHYQYNTHYDTPQSASLASPFAPAVALPYLDAPGTIENAAIKIEQTIVGMVNNDTLYELMDADFNPLAIPEGSGLLINPALKDLYDLKVGDEVTVSTGESINTLTITGIAFNAQSNCIYMSQEMLSHMLSLPASSYTGVLSMENSFQNGTLTTRQQRIDALQRDSVSNRSSAVINQVIGCFVGSILLFLALLLNFQDSTRDILILCLMGYPIPKIRKMLIDIYKPIVCLSFFITLIPGIALVRYILKSLSLQIGDYIPFQTNAYILTGIFILLNAVYLIVQTSFNILIKQIIKKEDITAFTD